MMKKLIQIVAGKHPLLGHKKEEEKKSEQRSKTQAQKGRWTWEDRQKTGSKKDYMVHPLNWHKGFWKKGCGQMKADNGTQARKH